MDAVLSRYMRYNSINKRHKCKIRWNEWVQQRVKESPYLSSLYFDYVLKFATDKFDKTWTNREIQLVESKRSWKHGSSMLPILILERKSWANATILIIPVNVLAWIIKTKTQVFNDAVLHETTFQLGAYIKKKPSVGTMLLYQWCCRQSQS